MPHPLRKCFSTGLNHFDLILDTITKNVLTKFNKEWIKNVTLKVKNTLTPNIIRTNVLTTFNEDWAIYVISRVFTRKNGHPLAAIFFNQTIYVGGRVLTMFYYSHVMKNASTPGGFVFQQTGTIF
ncbi:hypothetical protein DPMN_009355 [Dreissena polymorpha]|uniref:Uncharacterized protein n=1 Tax=Dreissena polymorpha TaxID=45954 RepID=A0A9D4S0I5_DREPO|nr:hypothetical protein DPMN_009355 [Dreissena polymorpha]